MLSLTFRKLKMKLSAYVLGRVQDGPRRTASKGLGSLADGIVIYTNKVVGDP